MENYHERQNSERKRSLQKEEPEVVPEVPQGNLH